MTGSSTGKNLSKTSPSRLGTYLATAVGSCGLATSADGAIVNIDLTNVQGNDITAPNGGVASGTTLSIDNWLGANTGSLRIYNVNSSQLGLSGENSAIYAISFAKINPFSGYASPNLFGSGETIDSSWSWSDNYKFTLFRYGGSSSADFGLNRFMGFRFGTTGNYNYGWIKATWISSANTFQLLSAAYESTPNTAILAGAAAPVPEPSTGALAALVLGGAALGVARRRRKQDAAATSEQAV